MSAGGMMIMMRNLVGILLGLVAASQARALPAVQQSAPAVTQAKAAPPAAAPTPQMERAFQESLSGVVFTGTFRMIGKAMGRDDSTLSEPIPEKYEIVKVSKIIEDSWMIEARVVYGDHDVTVPVVVRVLWAGDTPVITLDKAAIPMMGTYSARVMIYGGYYSGMWFGDGYGGIMSGQITRRAEPSGDQAQGQTQDKPAPQSAPSPGSSTPLPRP